MSIKMKFVASLCAIATLSGCAPRAAYVGPINAFSTQTEKFGGAVNTEVARFNTDRRGAYLRHDLFGRIQQDMIPASGAYKMLDLQTYLCNPRKKLAEPADNARYLSGVAAALKDVSSAPSKETTKLLASLLTSYEIDVPAPTGPTVDSQCVEDIKAFPDSVFPVQQPEFAVGEAVDGAKELWKIFGTLSNAVLQQVDEGRRAKALQDFLGNPEHVKSLRAAISNNATFLDTAYSERRHLDVYATSRALSALQDKLAATDLRKLPTCKALLDHPPTGRAIEAPAFQACFAALSASVEPEAAKLLQGAAAYDKDAVASPKKAGEELNKTLDKLNDLANGKLDAKAFGQMVEALANAAIAIETLHDKIGDEETDKSIAAALRKITGGA